MVYILNFALNITTLGIAAQNTWGWVSDHYDSKGRGTIEWRYSTFDATKYKEKKFNNLNQYVPDSHVFNVILKLISIAVEWY